MPPPPQEVTNYHFEVAPNALQGALDRFAQFFLSPLCLEGALEREVRAVDSEFAGVRQDDACRASQLVCHTVRGVVLRGGVGKGSHGLGSWHRSLCVAWVVCNEKGVGGLTTRAVQALCSGKLHRLL